MLNMTQYSVIIKPTVLRLILLITPTTHYKVHVICNNFMKIL